MTTETERIITEYCRRTGIAREQYEKQGTLQQEQIDAMVEYRNSDDDDLVMPLAGR